jgi:hypothetical protein
MEGGPPLLIIAAAVSEHPAIRLAPQVARTA